MKIVLFVEGSSPVGSRDQCARLWNTTLLPALGRTSVDVVVPIGKDAITNMLGLPGSSSAPGLDARICDARKTHNLEPERDALIVAWDLEPVDEGQRRCAWDEKLSVYQGIAHSPLPLLKGTAWTASAASAAKHLKALEGVPPTGHSSRIVEPGSILAVCMEPMFEALFTRDGRAVRRALDLKQDPPGWPTGWGPEQRDPSKKLMGPAIAAIRRMRPKHQVRRIIREAWENAKDEWSEYIIRKLLTDETQHEALLEHSISQRFSCILPPSTK